MSNYEATKYDFDGANLTGIEGIPTATIVPWSDSSVPSGFLECDGTAVSRTTYSALFAIIGTTYGTGDGSTTFNVPDLQDNVPIGKSNNKALASTGGANTVANSGNVGTNTNINVTGNVAGSTANATLSTAQLASHSHSIQVDMAGNPSPNFAIEANNTQHGFSTNNSFIGNAGSGQGHSHNMSANFSGSGNADSSSTFTGSSNSVLQPYLTVIYIIKT
jgi:microcystin-dependent protein